MELLVAMWSVRLAAVAAVAVGMASVSAGTPPLEVAVRAVGVAAAFTTGGRMLLGRLEPPERRISRLLASRTTRAGKRNTAPVARKGDER